jgi:hypothetical protein
MSENLDLLRSFHADETAPANGREKRATRRGANER